ncbi:Uncharacterised protein [Staphylococcus saccharolyticus]|uniref:Uncharacterized protein n=1 Tax=Staphylococcus saccharolyticus TaxID=33028 RepID=A0A380H9G2_9STAP|nr:Uncharacterised protein [Staphylococcus saccharolyticus]
MRENQNGLLVNDRNVVRIFDIKISSKISSLIRIYLRAII